MYSLLFPLILLWVSKLHHHWRTVHVLWCTDYQAPRTMYHTKNHLRFINVIKQRTISHELLFTSSEKLVHKSVPLSCRDCCLSMHVKKLKCLYNKKFLYIVYKRRHKSCTEQSKIRKETDTRCNICQNTYEFEPSLGKEVINTKIIKSKQQSNFTKSVK